MTGVRLTRRDKSKPELHRWLLTHGLDPQRLALDPGTEPEIRDGRVTAVLYVLDRRGRPMIDTEWTGDDWAHPLLVRLVDVPQRAPLPDGVGKPIP